MKSLSTACRTFGAACLLVGLSLSAVPGLMAQTSPLMSTDDEVAPLKAEEQATVVERIAVLLNEHYVFPDVAEASGRYLKERLADDAYADVTEPEAFAHQITKDLQYINHDKHMRVRVRPSGEAVDVREDPAEAFHRQMQEMKQRNFGFERLERLDGNVGYLDLRNFMPVELAGQTAVAAMRFLENTDAVIIDVRKNGGGSPAMVQLLCSFFFDHPTHLNSLYRRAGDRTDEFWTLETLDGVRRPDVPLFVLTSNYTFSAAEEFTYNLKTRERATIVGETTGGGANPGGMFPVTDRFHIFIPTGRAINPVTGTNWEGVGVEPDIPTDADEALNRAHEEARNAAETYRAGLEQAALEQRATLKRRLSEAETRFAENPTAAAKTVREALAAAVDAGHMNEMTINQLGYHYLGQHQYDLAIAVFGFNVAAYPESANVYDSLGEAYMENGQRDLAIKNYRQSLTLDPGNTNARERLIRLGANPGEEKE